MVGTGVPAAPECITKYNEMKMGKKIKYIIYKLTDDLTQIVIEEVVEDDGSPEEEQWKIFAQKLIEAKQKSKTGKEVPAPRFAVYDFGIRNKVTPVSWSPENETTVQLKVAYSGSKETFFALLTGTAKRFDANEKGDLDYGDVLKEFWKS